MHILLFLLFLINISHSYISASEEIKKSTKPLQLKTKQRYKIHNKKKALNTFFNSFNQTKEAYKIKNFATAAWTATATKKLFDCYDIENNISENIKQELEEIFIHSHLQIQKPDLILSEIKKYLEQKCYPQEETTQISFMLLKKSFQLPNNAKKLKKTLTENAFDFFSLGNTNTPEIISNSLSIIKNQTTLPDIRNIYLTFLWGYATKKDNMDAQCILGNAYSIGNYGLEKNIKKTLAYVDYFTENLVKNTAQILPDERTNLYSFLQQHNSSYSKILLTYCQFVELSQTTNQATQQKIFNLIKQINDQQSPLRTVIFQFLYNTQKASDNLINLLSSPKQFHHYLELFTPSDGDFAIPLLRKQLNTTLYAQEINYLLGLMLYKKNDYYNASTHFFNALDFLKQNDTKSLLKLYEICSSDAYQNKYITQTKSHPFYNAICQLYAYYNVIKTKPLLTEKDIEYIEYALTNNLCNQDEHNALNIKLGLTFYDKENYDKAYSYLSLAQDLLKEQKNILALYKMLEAYNTINSIIDNNHVKNSMIILNNLFSIPKQQIKHMGFSLTNFLEKNALSYAKILLQEKNYTDIYKIAMQCILHNCYHVTINIIKEISDSLDPKDSDYTEKLQELHTSAIYQKIKKRAYKNTTLTYQGNKEYIDTMRKSYDCICQIDAHHFAINNNSLLTKDNIISIEHALTNNLCSPSDHAILSTLCGNFYLQKGKKSKSISDYDKAITYENFYALYKKACLLLQKEETVKETIPTIIDLLEKHAKSDDPRKTKSLNTLGNLYCEFNSDKIAQFFKKNNKDALHYLQESFNCNDFQYASLLGYLYASINTNNNARLLKNLHNALVCFDKSIYYAEQSPKHLAKMPLSLISIYFTKARVAFHLKYYDQALECFEKICSDLGTEEKELALYYMSLCQIYKNNQKDSSQEKISSEEKKALEYLSQGYLIRQATPLNIININKDMLSLIKKYTNDIINKEDSSEKAIEECFALGDILYSITAPNKQYASYHQHAINCIKYAAEKDYPNALLTIQCLPDTDIHPFHKLTYAEHTLEFCQFLLTEGQTLLEKYQKTGINIAEIQHKTIIITNSLYPKNIFKLYDYMMFLSEAKRSNSIKRYLQSSQIIKLKDRIPHSPEIQKTIEYLLEKTFLNDYLKTFNSSTTLIKKEECNAALMHALLLLQSNKPQHLTKSAQILIKLDTLTNDKTELAEHLAYAYYKLGMLQKPNSILHIEYFKKSALLENIDATIYLTENFINNNAEIIKLCKKDHLIEWLSNSIHSLNKTSSKKQKYAISLLDTLQKTASVTTTSLQTINPIIEQIQAIRLCEQVSNITKQTRHPYYFDLVQRNTNENYIKEIIALDLKTERFFTLLSQKKVKQALSFINDLVEKKQPTACITLASYLYLNNDFTNSFNAFEKTLIYGLVPAQNSSYKIFVNGNLLSMIISFLLEAIQENRIRDQKLKTFWNNIKQSLIKHNINMDYFIKYIFDTNNYNLTHNSLWGE